MRAHLFFGLACIVAQVAHAAVPRGGRILSFQAPPAWPAQYNLSLSTYVFPHWGNVPADNHSFGYWIPSPDHPWGLVQLDGSVGQALCCTTNQHNGTCESTQALNARMIKDQSPQTRVFSYHNVLLALGCFESQNSAMYDPAQAGLFLQYANGTIYNDPTQPSGGQPGSDQYLWNYTNASAASWVLDRYVAALGDSLDGTFLDDNYFPEEHGDVPQILNMSASAVQAESAAQAAVFSGLQKNLLAVNKTAFQALQEPGAGIHWNATNTSMCTRYLRAFCVPAFQQQAILLPFSFIADVTTSIASFLLARGPIAFLGFGWPSDDFDWRPEFSWDVGEPLGPCVESPAGRFSRPWTYGDVFIDCNTIPYPAAVPHA